MDSGVAVAVRHVEFGCLGVQCDVGAAVEGVAAHEQGRRPRDAQGEDHCAVQLALAHGVVAVVRQVDAVVWPHGDAVGPGIQTLAPRAEEFAVFIEDDHGVFAPVEYVHVVRRVHAHCGTLFEGPTVGELTPTLFYLISEGT